MEEPFQPESPADTHHPNRRGGDRRRGTGSRHGHHRRGALPLPLMMPLAVAGVSRMAMMGRGGGRGRRFSPQEGPLEGRHPFRGPGNQRSEGGPPFGFGGGPFGRQPRARRGDVRGGILALLQEGSFNGYQIIQEFSQRSIGAWRASPGAVYPALQQLEDEGLIVAQESDGKRTFSLTDAGREYIAAHPNETAAPWETMAEGVDSKAQELGDLLRQVSMAAMQVMQSGTEAQIAEARKLIANTRRSLYRILAEDEESTEA